MLWATNIMFSKTSETKILFDLVEHIKAEYQYYAGLYQFYPHQYRNDFVFSIACHIMGAHGLERWHGELPIPLLFKDTDKIINIRSNGQLTILLEHLDAHYVSKTIDQDVHFMNKYSLLDKLDQLMELAND